MFGAEVGEPGLALFGGLPGLAGGDLGERGPHPGWQGAGVAADVDGRVLLDEVPDLVLVGEHLALGVLAPFPWLSGEGRVDPDARGFLEFAHFVGFTARLG